MVLLRAPSTEKAHPEPHTFPDLNTVGVVMYSTTVHLRLSLSQLSWSLRLALVRVKEQQMSLPITCPHDKPPTSNTCEWRITPTRPDMAQEEKLTGKINSSCQESRGGRAVTINE